MLRRRSIAGLVASISLANILFLQEWERFLGVENPLIGYYFTSLTEANYVSLMLNVLLVGAIAWILVGWFHSSSSLWRRVQALAVCGLLFFPLNAARRAVSSAIAPAGVFPGPTASTILRAISVAAIVIAIALMLLAIFSPARLRSTARTLGLLFSPFLLYTFASAIGILVRQVPQQFENAPPASVVPDRAEAKRVAMIVLDAADYRLIFEDRPSGLELPELDRLRAESFSATEAFPPSDQTDTSVPSYLTGATFTSARPTGPSELMLEKGPQHSVAFSSQANVFSRARARGRSAGLVGWWHPYCRVIGKELVNCHARGRFSPPRDLLRSAAFQLGNAITVGPLLDRDYILGLSFEAADYVDLMKQATKAVANRKLDVVFIHLPVPHMPRLYDRWRRKMVGPGRHKPADYIDNLALADHAIGELRGSMEKAGVWDSTALIVTSDHSYRESREVDGKRDLRVPFIVKLPGRHQPTVFSEPVNSVVLSELALHLLDDVPSARDLAAWMSDKARTNHPSN